MVDMVVHRHDLRQTLIRVLALLANREVPPEAAPSAGTGRANGPPAISPPPAAEEPPPE